MKIKISFYGSANQGSFALDAIATTIQGDWDSRSSTDSSGIITDVDPEIEEWVKEVLDDDDNVEFYEISEE